MTWRRFFTILFAVLCISTAALALVTGLNGGWHLRTGLLDLLPHGQDRTGKLISLMDGKLSRELVLVIGHRDPARATALAAETIHELGRSRLADISPASMPEGMEASWWQLWNAHLPRLLPDSLTLAADRGDTELLARHITNSLYLPYSVITPDRDPFQIASSRAASMSRPGWGLCGHFPCREKDGFTWVLLRTRLPGAALDSRLQDALRPELERLRNRVTAHGGQFLSQGVVLHGEHERTGMIHDMNMVGLLSLFSILTVFLAAFRTPRAFAICLGTVLFGIGTGFIWTHALFHGVHALTLAFGAAVTGLCSDYAIFLMVRRAAALEWLPSGIVARYVKPLFLALITTLLSFLSLALTGFPGLTEIAVFALFGLSGSWLFAVAVLPVTLHRPIRSPFLSQLVRSFDLLRRRPVRIAALTAALLSGLIGLPQLRPDHDVRRLQSPAPDLARQDSAVSSLLQGPDAGRAVLVEAPSAESLLERMESLDRMLTAERARGRVQEWISLTQTVPSLRRQRLDSLRVEALCREPLRNVPATLGIDAGSVDVFCATSRRGVQPLRLDDFLASPAAWGSRDLILDTAPWRALVPVTPRTGRWTLPQALPGCTFLCTADLYTDLFAGQSRRSALLVAGMYLLTFIGLCFALGHRRALAVLIPPCLAGIATLGVLGILGTLLHFFGLMALTLVLGAGVDYALYLEDADAGDAAGRVSVLLSAVTSLLSFGSLWLCSSPVLSQFGLIVMLGLTFSLLLAPWAPLLSRKLP